MGEIVMFYDSINVNVLRVGISSTVMIDCSTHGYRINFVNVGPALYQAWQRGTKQHQGSVETTQTKASLNLLKER